MNRDITRHERLSGGMWGLLVGDGLGVPYEFSPPWALPATISMQPPRAFPRAHLGTPPGTWSDDGAQALCLLDSLLDVGFLHPPDLASRLLAWLDTGYLAVDGRVFDCGMQTAAALVAHRAGRSVPNDGHGLGNGALMRVLPLALWHQGPDRALIADAVRQAAVTHPDPLVGACCALYCLWARAELDGLPTPWATARAALAEDADCLPHAAIPIAIHGNYFASSPSGSGHVLDTLHSAHWACAGTSYRQIVTRAIRLGHDTDTTAAVAGGIAGLRYGLAGIPARWSAALRGKELAAPLIARLVTLRGDG